MTNFFAMYLLFPLMLAPGTKKEYSVSRIPPDLRKDATAVVRLYLERFEIKNDHKAIYTLRRVVTIFDSNDRGYGDLIILYGGNTDIEELEGSIYDAEGNEIRKLDDDDTKDYAAFGGSLYTDSRLRVAQLYHNRYPYTIEFSYEIEFDGFINWPYWQAQRFTDPTELSRFEVITSGEHDLRYWCNRDSVRPTVTGKDNRRYLWEVRNLPRVSDDVVGDVTDITTLVMIAPDRFVLEGYDGNMDSWKEFGRWYAKLSDGRNQLPEPVKQEIRAQVDPTDNIETKVTKLYRYMQDRTRYISVQLGIGGWQPFDATYVHERGYGDCKALSNYMITLLETAGVTGYPVLINNGFFRFSMIKEFPSNQFNHVIVCVPNGPDSLWLECTSQSMPVGRIGMNSEDRNALLITPEGGVVVHTPTSSPEENMQKRIARVTIDRSGNATCMMTTVVSGNQQDRVRLNIHQASPQEREQWFVKTLQIPHVNLTTFSVQGLQSKESVLTLTGELSMPRFATISGSRIFFRPNLTERMTKPPPEIPLRLSPIRFGYPFCDSDSVYYSIPPGYVIEALPDPAFLESSFGHFRNTTQSLADSAIVFVRELTIDKPEIPAEEYESYRSFFTSIFKADRSQAVIVKRTIR